jgi:hypothetical protein
MDRAFDPEARPAAPLHSTLLGNHDAGFSQFKRRLAYRHLRASACISLNLR